MTGHRIVELLEAHALSPSVRALRFACVDGEPIGHVAGQWLNFDAKVATSVVRRAYSIASAPDAHHPEQFEIAVTRVDGGGGASRALHALEPGDRVEVDGPHGFFTREQSRHLPALFIGTGTGLCPLRAMLQDELADAHGPPLQLLFGCRTEADILWGDQLQAWAASHSRFSVHVTLSQGGASWPGLHGYVQTHLAQLIDPSNRPHVYACGLTKMVSDVRRTLKQDLGYDRKLIHSERYD
jgi:CDP-4-dehydro-6-deoxyglucose reductase